MWSFSSVIAETIVDMSTLENRTDSSYEEPMMRKDSLTRPFSLWASVLILIYFIRR